MLKQLSIQNVALIDRQQIQFDNGFSVLTGETGAGKSIIIEALNFVLGERASRELIKSGEEKASVEATFSLQPGEPVYEALAEQEIEAELRRRDVAFDLRGSSTEELHYEVTVPYQQQVRELSQSIRALGERHGASVDWEIKKYETVLP